MHFCTVSNGGNMCIIFWRVVWRHLFKLFEPCKCTVRNLPAVIWARDAYWSGVLIENNPTAQHNVSSYINYDLSCSAAVMWKALQDTARSVRGQAWSSLCAHRPASTQPFLHSGIKPFNSGGLWERRGNRVRGRHFLLNLLSALYYAFPLPLPIF